MNAGLLHPRHLGSLDALTSRDLAALLQTAASLKAAAATGQPQQPLRGKNIAVMCESHDAHGLQHFSDAASALGAQVAHIRPSRSRIGQPGESPETAQLLGRLYDAIDCEGLPASVVRGLEREVGRPVFDGLGDPAHPLRVLGDLMTLREHSGKPFSEITVSFRGDLQSTEAAAWRQSAALAGFSLHLQGRRGHGPDAADADFIWDEERTPRTADGRVMLACGRHHTGSPHPAALGGEQVANQRYALQAVLCSAVG